MDRYVVIGHSRDTGDGAFASGVTVEFEDPYAGFGMRPWYEHWDKPWYARIREDFCKANNLPLDTQNGSAGRPFGFSSDLFRRHTLVVGKAGSGKTRLALYLLKEQLQEGCSAVVLDIKKETVQQALAVAGEAGLAPDQITVIWPDSGKHIPGWNPLTGSVPEIRQTVSQFVAIIESCSSSWGPRLQDVLTNALTVIAGQRLSLYELVRFLQMPEYREALLRQAQGAPAWTDFLEEHEYFALEFGALSAREQASIVAPVLNKIRAFVSNEYLRSLFCAEETTLDIPGLWRKQRLIVGHLDEWTLGPDGVRLLAGMLSHALFKTAMRSLGALPVVLMLDEIGMQERTVGKAITDTLAVARSQNLRVLACCQHLEQMSDGLRSGLLTNTALRVFFNLGIEDAKKVAQIFPSKQAPERLKAVITAAGFTHVPLQITDEHGGQVYVSDFDHGKWIDGKQEAIAPGAPLVYRFVSREEYLRTATDVKTTKKKEDKGFLRSLLSRRQPDDASEKLDPNREHLLLSNPNNPEETEDRWKVLPAEPAAFVNAYVYVPWEDRRYEFSEFHRHIGKEVPYQLRIRPIKYHREPGGVVEALEINLPVPSLKPAHAVNGKKKEPERGVSIPQLLMSLPQQEAIVRTETGEAAHVKIVRVPFAALPDPAGFIGNCQDPEEIAAAFQTRKEQVEAVTSGKSTTGQRREKVTPPEIVDDGSF